MACMQRLNAVIRLQSKLQAYQQLQSTILQHTCLYPRGYIVVFCSKIVIVSIRSFLESIL